MIGLFYKVYQNIFPGELMKKIIFILFLLLSQISLAEVYIDKDVYDTLDGQNLNQEIYDNIIDSIYEGAYEMSTGDDGRECPTEVYSLNVLSSTPNEIKFSYEPTQDYVSTYGCMSIPAQCLLTVVLTDGNYQATTQCEWLF